MKYNLKNALDLPPVWLLLFMLVVWRVSLIWNPLGFDSRAAGWIGWVLIALGLGLMIWAFTQFLSHKTSVVPRNIPSTLIARGPYRFSRNPIYLADALVLLGFSLLMGSGIGIILVPVFMRVIEIRFIMSEEAGIWATYPDTADQFFAATRRWL